jgi:NifB/MoaA-like Fe-S oxidoreductase
VFPVKNKFFGETVTVTGLVTATDIIEQTRGIDLSSYRAVLIPAVMLKEFETVFLDDVPLSALESELNCKITVMPVDGEHFANFFQAQAAALSGEE